VLFLAFSMKLSPARRVVFGGSLLLALVGLFNLFRGFGIIQIASLPSGLYSAPGVETLGTSQPANTVGGDFYDILPLEDGRLVVTVGDVAGKGSPAALLLRHDGRCERLADGGISLGMFEHSTYTTGHAVIQPNELLAVYSDGITEAENPSGTPTPRVSPTISRFCFCDAVPRRCQ
jgi:serine phosphatase RsbU (regulator of sigma subunit)